MASLDKHVFLPKKAHEYRKSKHLEIIIISIYDYFCKICVYTCDSITSILLVSRIFVPL